MYQKIGILAVLASVLLSAGLLATPSFKVANAQENMTQGNQTQGLDVNRWIVVLKEQHPILAEIEQDQKVKDAIVKIKALQDPQEAVKALDALYSLQQLMNLKTLNEAQ